MCFCFLTIFLISFFVFLHFHVLEQVFFPPAPSIGPPSAGPPCPDPRSVTTLPRTPAPPRGLATISSSTVRLSAPQSFPGAPLRDQRQYRRFTPRHLAQLFYVADDILENSRAVSRNGSLVHATDWLSTGSPFSVCIAHDTSGGTLCIFGSHTFVPTNWMCKKQTSVSHSSTESEIISLDAGLRLDGIIVSVLGNTIQTLDRPGRSVVIDGNQKSRNEKCVQSH